MIGKNYKYRWLNLADRNAFYNMVVMQDVTQGIDVRFKKFDNANFHGTYWEKLLMEGRTFAMRGIIHWTSKELRGQRKEKLMKYIIPEYSNADDAFYDLFRETDNGLYRTTKVMVAEYPTFSNKLASSDIEFGFVLYSGRPEVYDVSWKEIEGWLGLFGGELESEVMPNEYNDYIGNIDIPYCGNRGAWCKITLTSDIAVINPKFFNLSNNTELKLTGSYKNVTINTLNIENKPLEKLVVTSDWQDVLRYRSAGAGITLTEKEISNQIICICDNYTDVTDAVVNVEWRDAFLE